MELSRRSFIASAAGIAAFAGLNTVNAIAETADGLIYKGRARGMRGHMSVFVTLADNRIVAVDVAENTETPARLSQAAIATIPQAIVEAQTVRVDTVTGATISSMALINAVTQALESAGVADQFDGPAPEANLPAPEDCSCDVLVLGGGLAGCNAAVAARYDSYGTELNERSVILVEKQGFIGGSSCLSGGTFCATQPLNSTANIDRYFEDAFPSMYQEGYPMDKELARNLLEISGKNALENQQLGFSFVSINGMGDPSAYTDLLGWFDEPRPNPTVFGEGVWSFAGWKIMDHMEDMLGRTAVDVRLNTTAQELVVEDGAVTGVRVEGPGGSYTIGAQKVIIATGGFGQNASYVEQYCPTYTGALKYMNAGCQGDAITMAQVVNGVVDGFDSAGGPLGVDMYYGAFNDMGYDFYQGINFPVGYSCAIVNTNGERFMADSATIKADEHVMPRLVMEQPNSMAWSIFDSANAAAGVADASAMQESIFRANSIAELAELIDVSAENLVATIESYNQMATSGTDDAELGVPAADMTPITQPPFYAVRCLPTICFVGCGLRVGSRCEVVNASDEVVPNLYACGEAAYQGSSITCVGGAMAGGRLAGDAAREALA